MEKLLQGESPKKTETFGPTSQPAYDTIYPSARTSRKYTNTQQKNQKLKITELTAHIAFNPLV